MKIKGKNFYETLKSKRLTTVAGAWVFYFLTGLLPIVFLLITAFSVFSVNIEQGLLHKLPEEFSFVLSALIETAKNATSGVTLFFSLTLIFSGSTLLNQMLKDGEYIYNYEIKRKSGLVKRVLSLFAVAVLFVIFLLCATITAFQGVILNIFGITNSVITTAVFFLLIIIIGFLIILLLNRFVSPVKVRFSELVLGSFFSLAIIVLGTIAFTLYLRFFKPYNAFYGSLAGIIVFILWAYILMLGLVLGISITATLFERRKKKV